jgi:FkbM family methyltransferase
MKTFIDVGGHVGETVEAVLDPGYGFEKIYSFEPVRSCAEAIRAINDRRLVVIEAGLSSFDRESLIFGAGSVGASIYQDHPDATGCAERCYFLDAAKWFRENISTGDRVYMKLNCEGSECDILENLLDSGEYSKITQVMIDFDARKIPSQRDRVESLKRRLETQGYTNFSFPEELMYGTGSNFGGIRNWLNQRGARDGSAQAWFRSLKYHVANLRKRKQMQFYKLTVLRFTPKPIVDFYYARIRKNL